MLFPILLALTNVADAVPLQITQQGRMLDSDGVPVDGSQLVIFRLYDQDSNGTQLWTETLAVQFNNGYYATVLGADETANPLDSEVLSLYPIYLEVQFGAFPPMLPRQQVNSAPYAQIAGVAESLDGGTVNALDIQIDSIPVIDGNRNWVGEPITIDWSSIQNVPATITDGDDNTQLSEQEVENYITNDALSLHSNTTLNGQEILTLGMDADTLADISCSDSDVPKWDGVAGEWYCGFDNDTLASLNCSTDEIPKFDGTNWGCGSDNDTNLTEIDVENFVTNSSIDLAENTTIGGESIVTSTTDEDSLGGLNCDPNEIAVFNGSIWECQGKNQGFLTTSPGNCDSSNIGMSYFDINEGKLNVCNGTEYLSVNFCSDTCADESTFECNTPITTGCGNSCGTTGTALAVGQCYSSIATCGAEVYDECGNLCPDTGTAFDSSQCASASATACNQAVTDDCGNDCGDVGTYCEGGEICTSSGCSSGYQHSDGFSIFANSNPVDVYSSTNAILACENYSGTTCQVGSCGGATYVGANGAPCSCNYRIWYFGTEGSGFISGSADYAGKTAIACQSPDADWY